MPQRWNLSFVWLALVVAWPVVGCVSPADGGTPDWPSVQPDGSLVLVSGGYGYELADVVLVDAQRTPEPGDIVQYDDRLNDSDCYSFGPGQYLAKVIALMDSMGKSLDRLSAEPRLCSVCVIPLSSCNAT